MNKVLIVGAGGFGREVLNYLGQSPGCGREWTIRGFLDDNPDALSTFNHRVGLVGSIADYQPAPDEVLVCAIAGPAIKEKVCSSLLSRGAKFMTFIHPTAIVGDNVRIGTGCVLAPYVLLTTDITVGDFSTFNCHSCCGHDVNLGDFSTLSSYSELTGGVQAGKGVFLGSHASVIPGRRLGDGVFVGAGSVVVSHLNAGQRVLGVPARQL